MFVNNLQHSATSLLFSEGMRIDGVQLAWQLAVQLAGAAGGDGRRIAEADVRQGALGHVAQPAGQAQLLWEPADLAFPFEAAGSHFCGRERCIKFFPALLGRIVEAA